MTAMASMLESADGIVDLSVFELPRVAERLAAHQPATEQASKRAAVALILRSASRGSEALYILRAEHPDDPWSGHMGLPGGRHEPEDASPLHTARRETLEEVGVDLERCGRLLGRLDDLRAIARGRQVDLVISPFVFELTEEVRIRKEEREVQEVHWIDFGALLDPAAASSLDYEHQGQTYELPCYRVNGRVIWGLTHRMLQSFFAVVGGGP